MELRLERLIKSLENLADIRNQDFVNPVSFTLPHPDPAKTTKHVAVVSIAEPHYLRLPYNGIWVVLDPESAYYRQALKLASFEAPADSDVSGAIAGLKLSWTAITRYDRAFDLQTWPDEGSEGPKGPAGDKGIVWTLAWSNTKAYRVGEAVRYQGASWLAMAANTGSAPSKTNTPWLLLADVGDEPYVDYNYIVGRVEEALGWSVPQT